LDLARLEEVHQVTGCADPDFRFVSWVAIGQPIQPAQRLADFANVIRADILGGLYGNVKDKEKGSAVWAHLCHFSLFVGRQHRSSGQGKGKEQLSLAELG
jgi:hypothetical protein